MKTKHFLHLVFAGILLASCSDYSEPVLQSDKALDPPMEIANITYHNTNYENIAFTYDNNGELLFLDEIFSKIYADSLKCNQEYSIFVKPNNNIVFYDNLEDALEKESLTIIASQSGLAQTRTGSSGYLAELTLYDDTNFRDRHHSFHLNSDTTRVEYATMGSSSLSFNDKCSSLILENNLPNSSTQFITFNYYTYACSDVEAVFIGYDDKHFSDRTIVCAAAPASVERHSSLPGFNDKLSSFKLFFALSTLYSCGI